MGKATHYDNSEIDGQVIAWRYDDRGRVEVADDGWRYVGTVLYHSGNAVWVWSPFRVTDAVPGPSNHADDPAWGLNCRAAIESLIAHDLAVEAEEAE